MGTEKEKLIKKSLRQYDKTIYLIYYMSLLIFFVYFVCLVAKVVQRIFFGVEVNFYEVYLVSVEIIIFMLIILFYNHPERMSKRFAGIFANCGVGLIGMLITIKYFYETMLKDKEYWHFVLLGLVVCGGFYIMYLSCGNVFRNGKIGRM
jgi:hypothetical protein